jgi:uncharacterized alpha-E superfamily protein
MRRYLERAEHNARLADVLSLDHAPVMPLGERWQRLWLQLNKLYLDVKSPDIQRIWNAQPHAFFRIADLSARDGAESKRGRLAEPPQANG